MYKSISPENLSFMTLRIHTIVFGGKYDLIFLLTKSAAVHLFHQYKIKLIISVYEHFRNLNAYFFFFK